MNDQKNNSKQLLCLDERQATWFIAASIALLCVIMVLAYIAGFRSAIRTVVDSSKKDSFADELYTSVTASTLGTNQSHDEGYYVQCKVPDKNTLHQIIQISKNENVSLSIMDTVPPTNSSENEKSCCYLVSSVVYSKDEAHTIATFLKDKAHIHQYDIVTVKNTQKLKGYLS